MSTNSYFNRDVSWLSFNERVLQEAEDTSNPLIERLRFLGIHSNNMDEFFRVRYSYIRRLRLSKDEGLDDDLEGYTPGELLATLSKIVTDQQQRSQNIYDALKSALEEFNIEIINEKQLTAKQAEFVKHLYRDKISPALTNLMINQTKSFPFLRDKSIYLAVKLTKGENQQHSIIEVPYSVSGRFVRLPKYGKQYVMYMDDVLRHNLDSIFHTIKYDHIEAHTLKITRDAELSLDDDVSRSFMEKIQRGLRNRRVGDLVRFVYDKNIADSTLKILVDGLEVSALDTLIPGGRYHNKKDLMQFPNMENPALEYNKHKHIPHPGIDVDRSIIKALKRQDIMLFTPYHDFGTIIRLLREAAIDEKVKEIKVTLYRLSDESQIISALINAAKNGKNVTVFIELQARFDEANNIKWTNRLRSEGIKVVSGVQGLKVHSKLTLIRRYEGKEKLVDYCIIGTGNYHEGTAKIYTDYHLMTSDRRLAKEARKVFQFIESPYKQYNFKHLFVSPNTTRSNIERLIDREIDHAKEGKEAKFWVKINSISDHSMIDKLYEASHAGVKIRMIVRGIFCLDLNNSKAHNITAISVVGRFLEHTRAFCFHNAGKPEYYISSADWMGRNLNRRVEVTAPIYDESIQREIRDHFEILWKDNLKSRRLDANQQNIYKVQQGPKINGQEELHEYVRKLLSKG